jgi:hypothetical protein
MMLRLLIANFAEEKGHAHLWRLGRNSGGLLHCGVGLAQADAYAEQRNG